MKYGVFIPNFGEYFNLRYVAQLSIEAEEAGWDGLFVWDHLAHPHYHGLPFADPWLMMTVIAMSTKTIRFGAMVTPLSRRRPWKLAKETVTLDHLSEGRLIFGAGLGFHAIEFTHLGEEGDPIVKAEMLDEGLEILDRFWSGEEFEFHGKHYNIQKSHFFPAAYQKPRIPVWVGGYWPKKGPLARAARWDGYFPLGGIRDNRFLSPADFQQIYETLKNLRKADQPFDLIASGYSTLNGEDSDPGSIDEYERAGATWWLEALDPWRFSAQEARQRIRLGPLK